MSDYADRPLVADSITGLRAFRVDPLGRLTGMTYKEVWRPGVNEAACLRDSDSGDYVRTLQRYLTTSSVYTITSYPASSPNGDAVKSVTEPLPPKHDVANINCSCGFYAVTHGDHHTYAGQHTVTGVVRGTGLVTVGSKGFRAAKAEIVALVAPDCAKPAPVASRIDRYVDFWKDHDLAASLGIPVMAVASIPAFAAAFAVSLFWLAVAVPLCAFWLSAGWAALTYRPSKRPRISSFYSFSDDPVTADQFDKVRRNYAGIPVYPTLAAALRDFPLPERHEPTPEDDDFWTRSAR